MELSREQPRKVMWVKGHNGTRIQTWPLRAWMQRPETAARAGIKQVFHIHSKPSHLKYLVSMGTRKRRPTLGRGNLHVGVSRHSLDSLYAGIGLSPQKLLLLSSGPNRWCVGAYDKLAYKLHKYWQARCSPARIFAEIISNFL